MHILIDRTVAEPELVSVLEDLVQENVFDSFTITEYHRHRVNFENNILCSAEYETNGVLLYGSIQFVKDGLLQIPGSVAFYHPRKYDCSQFMSIMPLEWFLNNDATFAPLTMLKQRHGTVHDIPGLPSGTKPGTSYFIRSDSGNKVFSGQVVNYNEWYDAAKFMHIDASTMMLIASAKHIPIEYRLVICDSEVITGCQTHINGSFCLDNRAGIAPGAYAAAARVAKLNSQTKPDRIFVCDVAMEADTSQWKVVELNAFSTSGLYNVNLKVAFVHAANVLASERNETLLL